MIYEIDIDKYSKVYELETYYAADDLYEFCFRLDASEDSSYPLWF